MYCKSEFVTDLASWTCERDFREDGQICSLPRPHSDGNE